jgi:PAS domain S-box-containing protein
MRVLNVEDDPRDSALIERELQKRFGAVELTRVDTAEAFSTAIAESSWDVIVADHKLPRFSSLGALAALESSGLDIPLIVVSGTMGLDFAVEAMRAGARDYLTKNDLVRLGPVVEREVRDAAARALTAARHALIGEVLEALNSAGELASQLRSVLEKLRRHAGADAAGIRMRAGGDFPYAAHIGFDAEFLKSEGSLCVLDGQGAVVLSKTGVPELACLCGAVLQQRPETVGLLTRRGLFVTGSIMGLIAKASLGQPANLPFLRSRCTQSGFESMALLPLRSGRDVVGLLQLSAKAPNRFGPDLIQFLEEIAPSLGLAIDRRRLEEERRVTEERYRVLVETSPYGVGMAGLDGTILKANQQLAELLGEKEASAIEGLRYHEFVVDEDRGRAISDFASLLAKGVMRDRPYRFRRGSREFDGEISASVYTGADGAPGAVVAVIRDVTERLLLQARLAQSDRLASVGMLAAGVAHEVNNPLTYVLYNLESLVADLPSLEAAAPKGPEPLDLVKRAEEALVGIRRIRAIIRDLKVFSKAGADRVEPVALNKVIQGAINVAFNEVKYRARLDTDFGEVPPVLASEGRLAQVFLNLLVNAAQSIPDGDVDHNRIAVRTWADAGAVFAEVRDTGSGMSEEILRQLFVPFFTTKPAGIGSGLGLSISREIVETAGGRITVESSPGKGSRFLVRLPAMAAAKVAGDLRPREAPVPVVPPRRGRVLIVDDEPLVRGSVVRLLRLENDVVEAGSGYAAATILAADDRFDAILCDLIMPELSGMELHTRLAASRPDLASRMIFMTGGAFTERALAFLDAVPNERLEKPFDSVGLRELIRAKVRVRDAG